MIVTDFLSPVLTGINRGVIVGDIAANSVGFDDIRSIASYSWSTISRATSIDYELCCMLMSNLKALNRLVNE